MLPYGIVVETTNLYIEMISEDACREHMLDSDRKSPWGTPIVLVRQTVVLTLFDVLIRQYVATIRGMAGALPRRFVFVDTEDSTSYDES